MFRDDFVWGVASSAYQIEGYDPEDGRGKCIWDTFTEEGRIKDHADAYTACDHIHRYKEDFALMKHLGVKAYRFSLSWARIMPEGTGRVNEKAIALYRDMIKEMKKNGIEPYITMYHWEFPQALQDRGGWLNEEVIDWFAEYAKVVAENFGDLCDYFITLNEPQCFVGIGHLSGIHAPGLKLDHKDVFQIAHNALRAHGRAVINLRKYAGKEIKVGYAPTCGVAYPLTNSPEDIEAARKVYFGFYQPMDNWTWNVSWFSDPVFLGKYPEEGLERFKEWLPEITKEDMELISQPLDFMGQNIYNGYFVKADENGNPVYADRPNGFPITAAKWPNSPECLYWGIKFIYERYKMPLYITENGVSCADNVAMDGAVHDSNRIEFLDAYLSMLQKAADEGADVRGYFHWTFLDNFEWDKGYSERFGMVWVDFVTQKRIAKDSAYWYQQVMECNGRNLSINTKPRQLLFLEPRLKERVWGGNRLKEEWGYECPENTPIGECWGISAHPEGDCVISEGYYEGKTLSQLWKEVPELFGNPKEAEFPLLVKVIDAKEDLSLQVHPDDAYATKNENSLGKKECWYVLDCPEDAKLVLGNNAKTKEELSDMIQNGKWDSLYNELPVKKGDLVQIDPGTLHAIKGGFLILETQQSSDVTYRIYDYDRKQNGATRELHIQQSLDVLTVPGEFKEENIVHENPEAPENVLQELMVTDCYRIWKLDVTKPLCMDNRYPYLLVSVIEGDGIVNGSYVKKGQHFIIPNGMTKCRMQGDMKLIISATGEQ